MDELRDLISDATRKIRWVPGFGLERELDWLRNMDDWMISKKRYWGLALPIYKCECGHFDIIGSEMELKREDNPTTAGERFTMSETFSFGRPAASGPPTRWLP